MFVLPLHKQEAIQCEGTMRMADFVGIEVLLGIFPAPSGADTGDKVVAGFKAAGFSCEDVSRASG